MTPLIIILLVLSIVFTVMWLIYNSLVRARNRVEEGYSGIDVQLKKRFELIPNLIEAVKGYNAYEAETLQKIVETRSASGTTIGEMQQNDQSITGALRAFRIHVEDYPDLKANTQFLTLMENLSTVENELSMARRYYNGTVRDYNTKMQVFPAVLIAGMFGHQPKEFYQVEDDERSAPAVNLTDDE